jgi:hypothetical protein
MKRIDDTNPKEVTVKCVCKDLTHVMRATHWDKDSGVVCIDFLTKTVTFKEKLKYLFKKSEVEEAELIIPIEEFKKLSQLLER